MRKSIERSTFPHCPCLPSPPRTNAACYQAKAHEINQVGVAEAAAILAKGDAEAKVRKPALSCFVLFRIFSHSVRVVPPTPWITECGI